MRITFPHMGLLYVPVGAMLAELGIDTVIPPASSARTVSIGAAHAPEFCCFPLKLSIGNLLEAIELGADSVLMAGGSGPCRFGYYAQVEKQVLEDLGHALDFHVLEPPATHLSQLLRSLKRLLGSRMSRVFGAAKIGWEKATACDALTRAAHESRPFERRAGVVTKWHHAAVRKVDAISSITGIRQVAEAALADLDEHLLPQDVRSRVPCVSVVGEIYTVLEPVANLNLEEKLGRLGVRVVRRVFITDWVRHNLLPRFAGPSEDVVCGHASPYLNYFVGGEGIQSVGYTVMSARERLHGVVHVMPFTCMPEIVARSVLPEVQNRHNIPVLSLSFDEHTGESGLETRLEAFVDLIREKGGFRHDAGASRS